MNIKGVNYIFILIISLFIMMGCGGVSSTDNQSNSTTSKEEKIAILIPEQELEKYAKATIKKGRKSSKVYTSKLVKEDAENGQSEQWIVYDKRSSGASISNVFDYSKTSQVIELTSNGLNNGFALGMWAKGGKWNDREHKSIQWSMNFSESFIIYLRVNTTFGYRYLYYTASDYDYGLIRSYDAPHYIHHGLGQESKTGGWRTFTRNLEADLKEFDPRNNLISIDGFFVRGSGKIDDVALVTESSTLTLSEKIDKWLATQGRIKAINFSNIFSLDKTRAVVRTEIEYLQKTENIYILDISNPNDIKMLKEIRENRFNITRSIKIKEKDSIIFARDSDFLIYKYSTGDLLGKYSIKGIPLINYLLIKENYALFHHFEDSNSILVKLDFTERTNPVARTLYRGEIDDKYLLAPDGSSVLVEDKKGFTYIRSEYPNTRFDAFYNPIDLPGSAFTSVLSQKQNKLFILTADEGSFVNLQIIDLTIPKETQRIDVPAFVHIFHSYPPIYLSQDEKQLIIPYEYNLEYPRTDDIIVDLP